MQNKRSIERERKEKIEREKEREEREQSAAGTERDMIERRRVREGGGESKRKLWHDDTRKSNKDNEQNKNIHRRTTMRIIIRNRSTQVK
jgi:hypothetical protein